MEVIVLFSSLIIGYLLLRSRGGEGLDIKFQLGPASTSKGMTNRLVLGAALAIWSAALLFVFLHAQGSNKWSTVAVPVVAGALVSLVPFLKNRK